MNELDWWIASQWEMFKIKEGKTGLEFNKTDKEGNVLTVDRTQKWNKLRAKTDLKEMYIVRYADDFKLFCRDYATAKKVMCATKLWLAENLHLQTSGEKSGITNLRKNYTTFLGIKFKVVPKGSKWVIRSHMADKSKAKVIKKLSDVWKDIKNPSKQSEIDRNISLYNAMVMGMHNYYCMATMVSADFAEIAFKVTGKSNGMNHNNRCYPIERQGEITSKFIQEKYGKSKQFRHPSEKLSSRIHGRQNLLQGFHSGLHCQVRSNARLAHYPLCLHLHRKQLQASHWYLHLKRLLCMQMHWTSLRILPYHPLRS